MQHQLCVGCGFTVPGRRVDRIKLRYRSRPLAATVPGSPDAGSPSGLEVELGEAADAAAPGQLACLMEGERVIGWGTIAPAA